MLNRNITWFYKKNKTSWELVGSKSHVSDDVYHSCCTSTTHRVPTSVTTDQLSSKVMDEIFTSVLFTVLLSVDYRPIFVSSIPSQSEFGFLKEKG